MRDEKLITDEMIEVAARAKYEEDREILKPALGGRKPCEWEELRDIEREVHMREARAALASVLPLIVKGKDNEITKLRAQISELETQLAAAEDSWRDEQP